MGGEGYHFLLNHLDPRVLDFLDAVEDGERDDELLQDLLVFELVLLVEEGVLEVSVLLVWEVH